VTNLITPCQWCGH